MLRVALVCPKCWLSMVQKVDSNLRVAFVNCYRCGRRLLYDVTTGEVIATQELNERGCARRCYAK
jgi:transcription elongation factor Elf1